MYKYARYSKHDRGRSRSVTYHICTSPSHRPAPSKLRKQGIDTVHKSLRSGRLLSLSPCGCNSSCDLESSLAQTVQAMKHVDIAPRSVQGYFRVIWKWCPHPWISLRMFHVIYIVLEIFESEIKQSLYSTMMTRVQYIPSSLDDHYTVVDNSSFYNWLHATVSINLFPIW